MSNSDNEFDDFLKELETDAIEMTIGATEGTHSNKPLTVEDLTEENMNAFLMKEVAGMVASCKNVADTLRDRIEAGDSYEGTIMGFTQSTDNVAKALKFVENRENLKMKHENEMKKLQKAHEQRLIEIDKRNEGRPAIGSGANVTNNNTFYGSREEFLKATADIGMKNVTPKPAKLEEK